MNPAAAYSVRPHDCQSVRAVEIERGPGAGPPHGGADFHDTAVWVRAA